MVEGQAHLQACFGLLQPHHIRVCCITKSKKGKGGVVRVLAAFCADFSLS